MTNCALSYADNAALERSLLRVSYDFWDCLRIWIYEHHGADPGNVVTCDGTDLCYEGEKLRYLTACMARKGWIPASRADPDFATDRVVDAGIGWWRRAPGAIP